MIRTREVSPRTAITSRLAPAAIGPYSQAIKVGNLLFCSGQIALDPTTQRLIEGGVAEQTHRTLENIGALLSAACLGYEHVVQCRIYLTDINEYAQVNEVYSNYFDDQPPCRETMEVQALPRGAAIAISCIAVS